MTATDRAIDAVEKEIETLRGAAGSQDRTGINARDRLNRLYLRRDALQAKQFRALQPAPAQGGGVMGFLHRLRVWVRRRLRRRPPLRDMLSVWAAGEW